MTGAEIVKVVQAELARKGISKAEFYEKTGISSATFSQWRTGKYNPTRDKIRAISNFLNINIDGIQPNTASMLTTEIDPDTADLLQDLRDRRDLRTLLESARGVPPSSVYELIATLEKRKEMGEG